MVMIWAILILLLFVFLILNSKSKPNPQIKPNTSHYSTIQIDDESSDSFIRMPNHRWPCFDFFLQNNFDLKEVKLTRGQKVSIHRTPTIDLPFAFVFENEHLGKIGSVNSEKRCCQYIDQMHKHDARIADFNNQIVQIRVVIRDMKEEFLDDWDRLRRKNEELKHWSFEIGNYDPSNLDFVIDQYFALVEELKNFDSESLFSKSMRSVKMPISKLSFLLEKGKRFEEAIELIDWHQSYFDYFDLTEKEKLIIERRKIRMEEKLAKLNH